MARLGSETLSRQELDQALIGVAGQADSLDAARQVLEQWVTNQLLFAEALRRGIDRDPGVRKNVEEAERAVVVDALLEELYGEAADGPTPEEVLDYYNQNQERLRLVEPYVRLRYIMTDSLELAREVRRSLARLDSSDTAAWEDLVARASDVPDLSFSLASSLVPETRAFSEYPQVAATVEALQPGRTGAVVADRGVYHIVQVLERVPAGTVPRQTWIEGALRQQLRIESRKLLYARLVQRLRNEALAREQLDIR
ncbi:MAG: peptidyl-prolyl cis-trans isomerase [Rhodothermales bacterium]|nr:peptidyl-prolyl cis-trans isomerase [Rhodothermales bacterium]MBO6781646.1 peptidyl-prolyl cis-trans isomerase [Rhodothermales bacterium]